MPMPCHADAMPRQCCIVLVLVLVSRNLILPLEKSGLYQLAELSVKIYEAEDLPSMNTDLVTALKTALLGARPI